MGAFNGIRNPLSKVLNGLLVWDGAKWVNLKLTNANMDATGLSTGALWRVLSSGAFGTDTPKIANVMWSGAAGNGTTDDNAAIAAAKASLSASGAKQGGVLYFPAGRYLNVQHGIAQPNVMIVGEGGGQWPPVGKPATQLLVQQDKIGITFNGDSLHGFGGGGITGVSIMPIWSQLSTTPQALAGGGNVSLNVASAPGVAGFNSSGTCTIQDGPNVGVFSYTTTNRAGAGDQFQNITVIRETSAGHTYAANSLVCTRAQGGVKNVEYSYWRFRDFDVHGFNDYGLSTPAFGIWNLGTDGGQVSQYASASGLYINGCARGIVDNWSSTKWSNITIDCALNSTTPNTQAIGFKGTNLDQGFTLRDMQVSGAGTLYSLDGTIPAGGRRTGWTLDNLRSEAWGTDALFVDNVSRITVSGGGYNNGSYNGAGNAIHIGANVSSSIIFPNMPVSVTNRFLFDGSSNLAAAQNVWIDAGVINHPAG